MANLTAEQSQEIECFKSYTAKNAGNFVQAAENYVADNEHNILKKWDGNMAAFLLSIAETFPEHMDDCIKLAKSRNKFFVNSMDGFFSRMLRTDDAAHYSCNVFMQSKGRGDLTPKPLKFKLGTLSYIGARTYRGKTTAMLSIAMDALHQGKRVYFYTNEETPDQIIMRAIRAQYFAENEAAADGNGKLAPIDDDVWVDAVRNHHQNAPGKIHHAIDTVESMLIKKQFTIIDGIAQRTFADIPASLELLDAGDVVLFDYIQHIKKPTLRDIGGGSAEYKVLQFASQKIADIAKSRDLIVIAGAQLNRDAASDKNAETSNDSNFAPDKLGEQYFRESGDLEQDADVIIQIGRQLLKDGNDPKRFYQILKQRGSRGDSTVYSITDNAPFSIYGCEIDGMNHLQKFVAAPWKNTQERGKNNTSKANAGNDWSQDKRTFETIDDFI